jgi:hypothetical protein
MLFLKNLSLRPRLKCGRRKKRPLNILLPKKLKLKHIDQKKIQRLEGTHTRLFL